VVILCAIESGRGRGGRKGEGVEGSVSAFPRLSVASRLPLVTFFRGGFLSRLLDLEVRVTSLPFPCAVQHTHGPITGRVGSLSSIPKLVGFLRGVGVGYVAPFLGSVHPPPPSPPYSRIKCSCLRPPFFSFPLTHGYLWELWGFCRQGCQLSEACD
jgi:hypothetical protein